MTRLTRRSFLPLVPSSALSAAVDWSRFRGPNGSGVAEETGVPVRFGPDENVRWSTALPQGKSSPALTGERIFLTGHQDGTLLTLCLDRADGKILWRRPAPDRRLEKMNRLNDEACATPVTDGENAYVFFGGYGMLGYGPDGRELWRRPLGPFTNFHGMGASPILADNLLIMLCDQDQDAYLIALDPATGETVWKTQRPEMVHSFSTPTVYRNPAGRTEIITPGSYRMTSYDAATGEEVWRLRGLTYQVKSVAVVDGDRLYFNGWAPGGEPAVRLELPPFDEALETLDADGDGLLSKTEVPQPWHPGNWDMQDLDKDGLLDGRDWLYYTRRRTSSNATMAVRLGGRGDVTATHLLWRREKSLPDVPAVLLYRDVLYLIRNGGILQTLDPAGGDVLYQGRVREAIDSYYASPVAADGKVFLVSEKGLAVVLRAGAEPEMLAVNNLGEAAYATPAIADSRIYMRTTSRLYCFG